MCRRFRDIDGLGGTGDIECLCCVVEMCRVSFSRTLYPVWEKLFYPKPTLRQPCPYPTLPYDVLTLTLTYLTTSLP
jgi:hypothetical protein